MKRSEQLIQIEKWKQKYPRFGMELPNGWFGKPYDNSHTLQFYMERDDIIILEVDKRLSLIFY